MAVSLKPLSQQVMVITGASSGIGLATARAAASQGARVVLSSRSEDVLSAVESDINAAGGQAIHVTADVSRRHELQQVADAATERFGGFDTWVNNAGVSIWGRLADVSDEDHRRLFEINFWGTVYGSLIAAEHLKRRGGALINVGSVASDLALPIQGMYSASKHAVRGFTDALRMELEEAGAPVSVTLIKPTSINTPLPQHARNDTDREPKLPPPVYEPEEVAMAILHAAQHPKRDIFVGGGGKAFAILKHFAPRAWDRLGAHVVSKLELRSKPPQHRFGALHEGRSDGRNHGDQPGYVMKSSLYTRAALHPVMTGALIAAAGLAVAGFFSSSSKRY
jgi:short-subunit dehydrogenase